jgi:hypothetical protein
MDNQKFVGLYYLQQLMIGFEAENGNPLLLLPKAYCFKKWLISIKLYLSLCYDIVSTALPKKGFRMIMKS